MRAFRTAIALALVAGAAAGAWKSRGSQPWVQFQAGESE
jgi:hypothetical protein